MILGTVKSINGTDLTLMVDGEAEPTTKKYRQTGFYVPKVGDRVTIEEINGSYVVTGAIGKNMRYTVPVGTNTIEIQLMPGKIYLISWFEIIGTSSTIAARMAMVATVPKEFSTVSTVITQFAASGTSNPFTGLANFKLRITKITNTRIGYVSVMEL